MELNNIAKPYAKAILAIAIEDNNVDIWNDMLAVASIIISDKSLNKLIASPKISKKNKADIIIDLLNKSLKSKLLTQQSVLIKLLAKNNRMLILPAIYTLFKIQSEGIKGYKYIQVISSYELSKEQALELEKKLHSNYGVKINLQKSVDKSLLGGVIIKDGDRVTNYSIKAKLEKLNTILAVN